jgi:hypothetical protein
MKFELGRYYKHTTGYRLAIRGAVYTTSRGVVLVAEDCQGQLQPIGNQDFNAVNYHRITEDEWLHSFSAVNGEPITEDKPETLMMQVKPGEALPVPGKQVHVFGVLSKRKYTVDVYSIIDMTWVKGVLIVEFLGRKEKAEAQKEGKADVPAQCETVK